MIIKMQSLLSLFNTKNSRSITCAASIFLLIQKCQLFRRCEDRRFKLCSGNVDLINRIWILYEVVCDIFSFSILWHFNEAETNHFAACKAIVG